MNTLVHKNFLYLKGNDNADVLFYINSSSFYRIYDPMFMREFQTVFENNSEDENVLKKLKEEIDEFIDNYIGIKCQMDL